MTQARRRIARETLLARLGPGPWLCECDCGTIIYAIGRKRGEGVIHHLDENPDNNASVNLQLLLGSCHRSHHHRGRVKSPVERARISTALLGNTNGQGLKGRVFSAETRARMSASAKRRYAR